MTTPERLRRRQRRESAGLAFLALGLVVATMYFDAQDDRQRACIGAFVTNYTKTSAVRSRVLEQESDATRRVIRDALSAQSADQIAMTRREYDRAIRGIDSARERNPVSALPEGICD